VTRPAHETTIEARRDGVRALVTIECACGWHNTLCSAMARTGRELADMADRLTAMAEDLGAAHLLNPQ
jgi:hypothetical protein